MAQLRGQEPADGADTLAIAQNSLAEDNHDHNELQLPYRCGHSIK
jgi:hypothetical protein